MPDYSIYLPEKINDRLAAIADQEQISKSDALARAFALLDIVYEAKRGGHVIVKIVNDNDDVISRITDI